ncbi:MAG: BatD family protein [Bacteroidota bacterium]
MKKLTFFWLCSLTLVLVQAQEARFGVSVSIDSLLLGNYTRVEFKLENTTGRNFQAPDFTGFRVVSGPSQSMSTSIINGTMSQSLSYSYHLEALDVGNYYIEAATIETDAGLLQTDPTPVLVVPNPDGIKQRGDRSERSTFDWFDSFSPSPPPPAEAPPARKKPRKKRRIYRL